MVGEYVELGASSAFSFLGAASLPEDLAARAAALELQTLALSDLGGCYGLPRFHRAAGLRGLRAIVGARLSVRGMGELRLLCESQRGYRNLCLLITRGHADRPKGECEVTADELEEHAAGLTCLAGPRLAPLAVGPINRLKRIYSHDHLAIEVCRHLDRGEERRTRRVYDLADTTGLPVVATNDVRYALPETKSLLDVLTCIREHTTLDEAGRRLLPNAEWRLKSARQMQALFADRPDAIRQTCIIAERCAFGLEDTGYRFPDYPTPPGESMPALLRRLTYEGARRRYQTLTPRIRQQLDRELQLIAKLGLDGYFLITWDLVRFAVQQKILVQGRGSAANSAVCYALGITAVDPIGMNLLFERFLSEERGEWPDIDLDLPSGDQREKVIQYVYAKYGPHGAAMTANVITYRDRSALREVGKALGFSVEQIDRVAELGGRWSSASDPVALSERMRTAGLDPKDGRVTAWIRLSNQIQNLPRHLGQHSGGMVIAQGRLDEIIPIEPASMEGRSVVQWDKDDCAALKIIKIDLLGLGMLAALEEAVPLIQKSEGITIDYARMPKDDPAVYDMMCAADTVGVFQIESRAQMATLPRLKPRCFYDLVIEIALIRPGPVTGHMVHPYLRRRAGKEEVVYPHPALRPILERTLGVPLFQEQLMRMAMTVAGFSGGEAEELRRAMGFKRSSERMVDIEHRLRLGMTRQGISDEVQERIVGNITSFASYGFPESHSASFALIAYASSYLKLYHPAAFLAALLNAWPMGFYHPSTLVKDAQRHGVRVLPIDVSRSDWRCTLVDKETVRLGLRYVQGLRQDAGERIGAVRRQRPFATLADFERRVRLSNKDLATLAELGALAPFGPTRRQALWQVSRLRERTCGLLGRADPRQTPSPLPEMSLPERVIADHLNSEMSVGPHPMLFLRERLTRDNILSAEGLNRARAGRRVSVAGLVQTRQRPLTAKGFFFVTLEDETGFANLIITPQIFAANRPLLVRAPGLVVEGIVQNQDGVVHLKCDRFDELSFRCRLPSSDPTA